MASRLMAEAAALAWLNQGLACTMFAPDAHMPDALVAELLQMRQNSPATCAAMDCMSTCAALEPQAYECVFQGLHIAVPILVRLASADAPLQTVKEVLELWVQEADTASCLYKRSTAAPALFMRTDAPAAGVAASGAGAASNALYALQREAFSANVRVSVHSATPGARHVLFTVLATALALLRDPRSYRGGAVGALGACEAPGSEAPGASNGAGDAGAVTAAAIATAHGTMAAYQAAAAKATKAMEVLEVASKASKEAVAAEQAALAAVQDGAVELLLAGPAGAAGTGAGNADMEQAPGQGVGAAGGGDAAEDPEEMPDSASEGAWMADIVHDVADHLAEAEVDFVGPDRTPSRNTCAMGWAAAVLALRLRAEARAGFLPCSGCVVQHIVMYMMRRFQPLGHTGRQQGH